MVASTQVVVIVVYKRNDFSPEPRMHLARARSCLAKHPGWSSSSVLSAVATRCYTAMPPDFHTYVRDTTLCTAPGLVCSTLWRGGVSHPSFQHPILGPHNSAATPSSARQEEQHGRTETRHLLPSPPPHATACALATPPQTSKIKGWNVRPRGKHSPNTADNRSSTVSAKDHT